MASVLKDEQIVGKNGVVIVRREHKSESPGYRTYEVYQRERVGESTEKIKPSQLNSDAYRVDPYPSLAILREHYPCYRDWLNNSYWITQYNDVTSIFADEANFETRPKAWYYQVEGLGRNLGNEIPVLTAEETRFDEDAPVVAGSIAEELASQGKGDLATGFAARFSLEMLARRFAVPEADIPAFGERYWRMQRGTSWDPRLQADGRQALDELITYFKPVVENCTRSPGNDMVSAMVQLDHGVTAADVVITLLEGDHETLHGALANLWFLLLSNPDEFEKARSERRLMKIAYLETLRHSTPKISAYRFARHEVERFGRLIPEGARLVCSAAAANRDSRVFNEPDKFIADRSDICHREPRGQYRADGLASGIAFGLGKPSIHPAVPEDRPRSHYAIVRDTTVTASQVLLEHLDNIQIDPGYAPRLSSLTVGEMHTCWKLPVKFNKK